MTWRPQPVGAPRSAIRCSEITCRCTTGCVRSVLRKGAATTEAYTLSLHDALPISRDYREPFAPSDCRRAMHDNQERGSSIDRKSTRLNSSHVKISYAVFCLKKKRVMGHRAALSHADRSRKAPSRRDRLDVLVASDY